MTDQLDSDRRTEAVPPDSDGPRLSRIKPPPKAALVVLLLFIAALSIRVINLGEKSLWVDEGASYVIAHEELNTILTTNHVAHPPGYYALLHFVQAGNESEAALRLPSALASAATVVLIYLIGRRLMDHRIGLFAAGLSMLSPLDIWYAQEARQAAPAAFLVTLGMYGLVRRGWLGRILALVCLLGGLYLDYVTALGWVAAGSVWAYLFWKSDRARFWEWLAITVIATAIFAPFLGAEFAAGFEVLETYSGTNVWYGRVLGSTPLTSGVGGILLLLFGGGLVGCWLVGRLLRGHRSRGWSALAVWTFVLVIAAFSVPRAYSVKKLLIVGWPIILLLVSYMLWKKMAPRWRRPAAIALLAVSVASSSMTLFLTPKDDWRGAVAYVNANAAAGDVAWTDRDDWAADAYVYYDGKLPVFRAPVPAETAPSSGDVWLITKRRPQDSIPAIEAEAWFDDHWQLVSHESFYRLAVRHYTP